MGTGYVVAFFAGLAFVAAITIYGVLTEGRRGNERLDRYGRVVMVIRDADGDKASWVIVDEVDAGLPNALEQGMHVVRAWLAAQGVDYETLASTDTRAETAYPAGPAVIRFLVRESVLKAQSKPRTGRRRRLAARANPVDHPK